MDVWLNGAFVDRDAARVSAFDAGLQHGVGLFETMLARNGDKESLDVMTISVSEGPEASFDVAVTPPTGPSSTPTDPTQLDFADTSTPAAEIVAWDWDFGGFGTSTLQDPSAMITEPGDVLIRLTITTVDGLMDSTELVVPVD